MQYLCQDLCFHCSTAEMRQQINVIFPVLEVFVFYTILHCLFSSHSWDRGPFIQYRCTELCTLNSRCSCKTNLSKWLLEELYKNTASYTFSNILDGYITSKSPLKMQLLETLSQYEIVLSERTDAFSTHSYPARFPLCWPEHFCILARSDHKASWKL